LNLFEKISGRDAKSACIIILYDYMLIHALDFVKADTTYKHHVIQKAYQLKNEAPEITSMITSINNLLTALDVPL
jgi:hypothetical protein